MVWPKLRSSLICLCVIMLSGWAVTPAQSQFPFFPQKAEQTEKEFTRDWFLAPGRNIERMIEQSESLIEDGRYREGVLLLQQILDKHEDFFLAPNSTMTLRRRIEQILLTLPPAGREIYELEYGKEAEYQLKLYEETRDASHLSDIMRQYRATIAGQSASLIVLSRTFDRGDYLAAATLGTDLLERQTLTRDQRISVMWQTAFSWNTCHQDARAKVLLDQLRTLTTNDEFVRKSQFLSIPVPTQLGPSEESASEGTLQAGKSTVDVHPVNEWRMPRGTVDRNPAVGALNSIMIDRKITALRRTSQPEFQTEVDYLLEQMKNVPPKDPAARQLMATNPILTKDLMVTRTLSGLSAFELPSGKKVWETAFNDLEFEFIAKNSLYAPSISEDDYPETLKRYLIQKSLMNDVISSTISSDGSRVYVIQNGGVLGVRQSPQLSDHPILTKSFNKLSAYDMKTGKISWQVGGSHSATKLPLAGLYFLGPPVEWNGVAYVLGELNQEIRLYALDPVKGEPLWSQPLALTVSPPEMDLERRIQGLTVSVIDGILICPTGVGVVSAFNPTTRQLLWNTYLFDTNNPDSQFSQGNLRNVNAANNPYLQYQTKLKQLIEPDWMDYPVICTSQEILVVSPEDDSLFCLNVDGTIRWKIPRNNNLCVAGIYQGTVLVYSDQQFSAIDAASGKPTWAQPIQIPQPTGQGLRAGSHYYLPVEGHRIWTIDLERGRLLVETALPEEISIGHLMIHQDQLALYTPDELWLFRSVADVKKTLSMEIAANPNDGMLWLRKGQLELQQHNDEAGIAALKRAYELNPAGPAREVLALSLLENLRTDFQKTQKDLELLKVLITDPQMKARLLVWTVNGLIQHGQLKEAYNTLIEQIDATGFADVLITTENNHAVRIDRWIDKRLQLIAVDPKNDFQDQMTRELTEWVRKRISKGDSIEAAFRNLPVPEETLAGWTKSVLKDPQLDSAALECHLIWLRQTGTPEQAGWASEHYADLIAGWKLAGWESRLLKIVGELGERFAAITIDEDLTGEGAVAQWKKKSPALFAFLDENPVRLPNVEQVAPDQNDASYRAQMVSRYPMRVLHGEDSAFLGWDFSINQARNAILIRDGLHQLQYQIRIPHNIQFQDPRNNYAQTQGHLATVVAGQTITTFNLMSLANRPGEAMWSVSLEPTATSVADVNRIFQEPTSIVSSISKAVVCTLTNQHLTCLDVLSGKTLWRHHHLAQGLYYPRLFTTSNHVIVCGLSAEEKKVAGFVLDVIDGSIVRTMSEDDAELVMNSLQYGDDFWRFIPRNNARLVVWNFNADGSFNRVLEQGVSSKSIFKQSYQGNHALLVDREGAVRVYDMQTRRLVVDDGLAGRFDPALIEQFEIHEDLRNIYLMLPKSDLDELYVHAMVTLNSHKFAGELAAYDIRTGRPAWTQEFPEGQALDQDQPREWPFLVLASNVAKQDPQRPNQNQNFRRVSLIDKRTGEILQPEKNELGSHETLRLYAYRPDAKVFEIYFSRNQSLRVTYPGK